MPRRKLKVKSIRLGPYSRGIVLPTWWLRLNQDPKELELDITVDYIEIRALLGEARGEEVGSAKCE